MGKADAIGKSLLNVIVAGLEDRRKRREEFQMRLEAALAEKQIERAFEPTPQQAAERVKANMQAMRGVFGQEPQGGQGMGGMTMQGFSVDPMTGKMGDVKFGRNDLSGEQQNRLLMLNSAFKDASSAKSLLFPTGEPSSQVSRILQKLSSPLPFGIGSLGDTEAQNFDSMMKNAVELRLRMETGAAAPPDEVVRVLERYRPLARNTPEANLDRLNRFIEFVQEGQDIIDPSMQFHSGAVPRSPTGGDIFGRQSLVDRALAGDETAIQELRRQGVL